MKIRIARGSDCKAIAALHAASWRSAYRGVLSNEYLDRNIASERMLLWEQRFQHPKANQYIVVAEDEPHIIGFACAYGNEDEQWGTLLDNLHVSACRKGQGVGSKLIADVALWCSGAWPGKGLFLWVFEQNILARRFYEGKGGVIAGEVIWRGPDGTAVNELRYAWRSARLLVPAELHRHFE